MSELLQINLTILILFLPLAGFAIVLHFGKRFPKLYIFETAVLGAALLLSIIVAFGKLTYFNGQDINFSFEWFRVGLPSASDYFVVELGILIDNLTAIMLVVVNLISFLIHVYSIEYMRGDSRYTRYFAYLGLFTFSMLGIVITDNFLMMYIFWELVGLSSYLLIGFWFEKDAAANAGKKAFLVNRIGDIGMFIGIVILFITYKSFSFDVIFSNIQAGNLPFDSVAALTTVGILVFLGAVGKSAQFPLHVWLPDAMEGPTPVSALIHAATMVAAGVYLLTRIFAMFTADALFVIAVIGALTAFIAATMALTQNDIKRVLAYSTVSQLGYMVMAVGVGAFEFAFFHLVTHAFFKACLFLDSGSVIHAMDHDQDIRNMGGLRKKMPLTYGSFLISTLAISGVPLTSGFLSKDGILAGSLAFGNLTGHYLIPILGFTAALMTAFYMFRLLILTFHGKPRDEHAYEHAHESPFAMTMPLAVLSILSIFIFYSPNPVDPEAGWFLSDWVDTPENVVPDEAKYEFMRPDEGTGKENITYSAMYTEEMHHVHYTAVGLSSGAVLIAIMLAFGMYQWRKLDPDKLAGKIKPLYKLSYNKWYLDEIYNASFISGTLGLSRISSWFDNKVVDGVVNGTAYVTRQFSSLNGLFDKYVVDGLVNFSAFFGGLIGLGFRKLQTGKVQTYLVFVIFSVVILILVFRPF